jgi:hypothetical protein
MILDVEADVGCRPEGSAPKPAKPEKTTEQIQKDIQDIIRQITSSVTFLPSVDEKCASYSHRVRLTC